MFNRRPGLWTLCTVFTGDREWLHTPQPPSSQPGTTCKWQFGLTRARCTSDHQTNWMEVIFDLFPTIHRTIYIVSSKMALCTTAQVFRIEHNCTKEFWSSVLCKLSTYGRVSHCERWEEDARTSQNLYRYLLFNHHILNLHPAFSFVSTITTVVPQMSLDLDAIDACRIWMMIYCRLYFSFHLHFHRLFLHLLHRSDVLGPWLHAGPGWREREPKVHEISSSPSSSFYWAIIIWKLTRDEDIQMLGERLPPRCLSFWFPPIWNQTEEIID